MNKIDDIDLTLDRLVENAAAMQAIADNPMYTAEFDALQKTQESLLAHLLSYEKEERSPLKKMELESAIELFDKSFSSGRQTHPKGPRMTRGRKGALQGLPD